MLIDTFSASTTLNMVKERHQAHLNTILFEQLLLVAHLMNGRLLLIRSAALLRVEVALI